MIKLYHKYGDYDEKRTIAALEKQVKIKSLFKEWIWQDTDRCLEVEKEYNKLFSKYQKKTYKHILNNLSNINKNISLYPYQEEAVKRIMNEKNTLLAFDVGAGKTYIMIATAMELKRACLSKKNMFVVPNNIVGQWQMMFKTMFPQSNVLVVEPNTFKQEMRQNVLEQICNVEYDVIIIAYSCFEMIPLSVDAVNKQMNNKLLELQVEIDRLAYEVGNKNAIKRAEEHLKKLTRELLSSLDVEYNGITFDQLKIDRLFVDEAHNFKNIPLRTNLRNILGINIKGSKKCLQMLHKVRVVQENNKGGGVVFATGTPICNSISDVYAMQMYLQYDDLKESHLEIFDNWVKTFANPEQVCEIDVDTKRFRFTNRFSRFFNLPELSKMFSNIAAFYLLDNEIELPVAGYKNVIIPCNENLQKYMKELCERTEKIRLNEINKIKDNMLKVSIDGRKVALDLRLVGRSQPYDSNSKIYHCVNNVVSIYKKFIKSTQIIFCDYSTPKRNVFNVYSELKLHLIEMGVPIQEIAFIHDYKSEDKKISLYEKVNKGIVRILIGSTFKLGVGANVQTKLKAIHHLDAHWRPADMVQREGRIIRRRNENQNVEIYRYICNGSFDSYSWQTLENKQKFISQFLSGSTYQRSFQDLEENVLTYAEVKVLSISNLRMKVIVEKENELRKLKILAEKFSSEQHCVSEKLQNMIKELVSIKNRLIITNKNKKYVEKLTKEEISLESKNIKPYLSEEYLFYNSQDLHFKFFEFNVSKPKEQDENSPYILIERLGVEYKVLIARSPEGNVRRIVNFLKN